MAELSALADGTLPAERRAQVEARVAASPELQELLERQQQSLLATSSLSTEEVPASLWTAVAARSRALRERRGRSRKLVPRIALAGVAAVAALAVAAVVLNEGPGAPTVADAARLATQAATQPAPPSAGKAGTRLAIGVEGVAFPDLTQYGWRAIGVRRGHIDGRDATVVFYEKAGRRLGYVIVSGAALPRPTGGQVTYIRRVEYRGLAPDGLLAVTWRRGGRTCVLIGQASHEELLKLASWPLSPR
jgi:anti-sigma factor RsiW